MTKRTKNHSVEERIAALREWMRAKAVQACIVPTGDPHMSEYISDHYKTREFITGFTGSAGTAVITLAEAGLWTDSRYFLQAAEELEGTGVTLYKQGLPETVTIPNFLMQRLDKGAVVSVDGRLVSGAWADKFRKETSTHELKLRTDLDLVGEIWADRPALVFGPVREYPLQYAGVSRTDKIRKIREDMAKEGADVLVLSALSDIAWLTNLRGSDIACNPVFFSFVIMTAEEVGLYGDRPAFGAELTEMLAADGIELRQYDDFYRDLQEIGNLQGIGALQETGDRADAVIMPDRESGERTEISVILDRETCSELMLQSLPQGVRVIGRDSPVMQRKAVKNPVEMAGICAAHLRDGVAMCKFLYWLKTNVGKMEITELSAAEKLHALRAEQERFMGDSFEAICGYGPHGAIVHYSATPASDVPLASEGLFLVDSGGQYLDGTTDVTRTIVLGPLTERARDMFTAVLRGHINLARAKFPKGLSGENLDYLAHEPLWQMGLDYRHGTGHGVGHYLNVHEDPNRIHWNGKRAKPPMPAFEEGMLTSDEPGYYEDGEFGIRHESLLLCRKDEKTAYGQFLRFEEVTLVPFDLEGIDPAQMQPDEIAYLNDYHAMVYQKIAPLLNEEERTWLRDATRAIRSSAPEAPQAAR